LINISADTHPEQPLQSVLITHLILKNNQQQTINQQHK